MSKDLFDIAYKKNGLVFGNTPTRELQEYLDQYPTIGIVLDLGCGEGRDTLSLLQRGLTVIAVDQSTTGLQKLVSRLETMPKISARLHTVEVDLLDWNWPVNVFDIVVGVTILDHLNSDEIRVVTQHILSACKQGAIVFLQVHTIDDPAITGKGMASEFSGAIKHYFQYNELLHLFDSYLRVLKYEEREEWDFDHGLPHKHGFAILLGKVNK